VPRPTRIITQVPCHKCIDAQPTGKELCAAQHHRNWRLRCIAVPRSAAVFPPLLVCKESHAVWREHYNETPRSLELFAKSSGYHIRFAVSYVSYEMDIFACFNVWWGAQLVGGDPGVSDPELFVNPFHGFDNKRIQHAGIGACFADPAFYNMASILHPRVLPALRTLSVIPLGPDPEREGHAPPGWIRMEPETLQLNREFELRDVSPTQLNRHPYFNEPCIGSYKISESRQDVLDVPSTKQVRLLVKAFSWHYYAHGDPDEVDKALEDLEPEHLSDDAASRSEPCPLNLPGCGPGGHTRQEIVDWVPPYTLDVKFLCDKRWLEELEEVGMFDEARIWAGDLMPFYLFRQAKVDRALAFPSQPPAPVSDSSLENASEEYIEYPN
jgi:hypothetical protein